MRTDTLAVVPAPRLAAQATSQTAELASRVEWYAAVALMDLQATQAGPRRVMGSRVEGDWAMFFCAVPAVKFNHLQLTDCERDCLTVLARAKGPMTSTRVREAIRWCGHGDYCDSVVVRSLSRLHRSGLILNSRSIPRGYYLVPTDRVNVFPREVLAIAQAVLAGDETAALALLDALTERGKVGA